MARNGTKCGLNADGFQERAGKDGQIVAVSNPVDERLPRELEEIDDDGVLGELPVRGRGVDSIGDALGVQRRMKRQSLADGSVDGLCPEIFRP